MNSAFAANCNLLVDYVGFFWPQASAGYWRAGFIIVVVASLTMVNVIGVRDTAMVSNVFTVGKLILIVAFIAIGLFAIHPDNYSFTAPPGYGAFSQSVLLLIYAFTGFEMAVIPAGEIRDPQRDLPRAILIGIAVVALLYVGIQVVCIGTLPTLATSQRPIADAAELFMGRTGAALISAGVIVSIIGNLNVLILAASRLTFAMGEGGELPRWLGRTHRRFRTPHLAILTTVAVMVALTLWSTFSTQVKISAITRLLSYAVTCAALIGLRRRSDAPPALFRAPVGVALAVASLVLAAWLLSNSTRDDARDTAIAAGIGIIIFFAYRWWSRRAASAR